MPQIPGRLITYCTNIHPGESWAETFDALRRHVPLVKGVVAPGESFPIGLRLSNRAALELDPGANRALAAWLAEQDCFIPTLNGFPFGSFHRDIVKEQVYLPDWRSPERRDYTVLLARLLAGWVPEGMTGSISTVPIAFGKVADPERHREIRRNLESVLDRLARLFDETGRVILLALEPEPGCHLETTEEVCRFFEALRFPAGLGAHLGICYDCCHQAVQFEEPGPSLALLASAGVTIAKVQVSSALRGRGADALQAMRIKEPCYLHQVVVRRDDGFLVRYRDLPEALSLHEPDPGDEVRCHFHVPIFHEDAVFSAAVESASATAAATATATATATADTVSAADTASALWEPFAREVPRPLAGGGQGEAATFASFTHPPTPYRQGRGEAGLTTVGTTLGFLKQFLAIVPRELLLEVETYTWEVLPAELRQGSVTDSISRELVWLKERLHA